MHKHGPAPTKLHLFLCLLRKTWKRKRKCKIQKKLSYYYHFSGALFSQHPHANKGSSKARQFILGVPLKFFWSPKNFSPI
jgi:hypothetical protein